MSFQSIISPEALLPEQKLGSVEMCDCCYGQLEGHRDCKGNFVVSRIISTDPMAYLDSRYCPGSIVKG